MSKKITVKDLKKKYEKLYQDEGITAVSCWTEPNVSKRFSEANFRKIAEKNAPVLSKQLDEAIDEI